MTASELKQLRDLAQAEALVRANFGHERAWRREGVAA